MKRRCFVGIVILLACMARGCAGPRSVAPGRILDMRLAQLEEIEGLPQLTVPRTEEKISVLAPVVATERDIANAIIVETQEEGYIVLVRLKKAAVKRISRWLYQELYSRLAIFVDGRLISAQPFVWEEHQYMARDMVIADGLSRAEAEALAARLARGPLGPANLQAPDDAPVKAPPKIDLRKRSR